MLPSVWSTLLDLKLSVVFYLAAFVVLSFFHLWFHSAHLSLCLLSFPEQLKIHLPFFKVWNIFSKDTYLHSHRIPFQICYFFSLFSFFSYGLSMLNHYKKSWINISVPISKFLDCLFLAYSAHRTLYSFNSLFLLTFVFLRVNYWPICLSLSQKGFKSLIFLPLFLLYVDSNLLNYWSVFLGEDPCSY